ncbi:MAG: hypothetical protein LUH03_08405 [Oscillospiraceae bacterium]|nr:hypothetical protein [Oscillospiraceae bacterium]
MTADTEYTPFLCPGENPDVCITFRPDDNADECETAVSYDGAEVQVRYHPCIEGHFAALRGCLIHTPVEQILLLHNRFFLHASFIASSFGGLLFTGNSGVGKSTQAELWREHRSSEIINGDRAIVAKEENGWRAYGSPYAGSSGYFVRADAPIRAIILLEQAQENRVTAVSTSEAFKKLFLQVSLNHSQPEQINRLCDLLMALISAVPIYRLRCTPDVRAVQVLEVALRKGELHETG